MGYTQALSEQMSLIGLIAQTRTATAAAAPVSNIIDMRYHRRALIVCMARAQATKMVKGMTITVWNSDATTTLASTAIITGSTLHTPATAGDYIAAVYEVTAEQIANSGYGTTFNEPGRYMKVKMTTSTNILNFSVIVLGDNSRYSDGEDFDLAKVSEVKRS